MLKFQAVSERSATNRRELLFDWPCVTLQWNEYSTLLLLFNHCFENFVCHTRALWVTASAIRVQLVEERMNVRRDGQWADIWQFVQWFSTGETGWKMEIATSTYSRKFGKKRLSPSGKFHLNHVIYPISRFQSRLIGYLLIFENNDC